MAMSARVSYTEVRDLEGWATYAETVSTRRDAIKRLSLNYDAIVRFAARGTLRAGIQDALRK
eukprot:CAMPEP_0194340594 /NCGR_PEP_ID=MMETSP0171-20130528/86907_1 /TAXON_ID=218684 /ORGANISM="Corethron pennatum, Strain L29A3" /LENGTH=61 /DNA_ID=CAMNT_0039105603 /DNA_START=17 /DNA_END=202 /DNA_ORIENTATION=+